MLPGVRWMAGWENPTGPQTINADLGSAGRDCNAAVDGDGNGVPTDDGKNWAYAAYDTQVCVMDYTRLAWDAAYRVRYSDFAHVRPTRIVPGTLFFDGNANGRCDTLPGVTPPCFDLDGNGRLDPTEDYVVSACRLRPGDSRRLAQGVLVDCDPRGRAGAGLFGASWPAHVATPEMAQTYWDRATPRSTTPCSAPSGRLRGPAGLSQGRPRAGGGRPCPRATGLRRLPRSRALVPAEPRQRYYARLAAAPAGYVETPANVVVSGSAMKAHAVPNTVDLDAFAIAAACEMADRVRFGVWDPDLDRVLVPDPVVGVDRPGVRRIRRRSARRGTGHGGEDRVLRVRLSGARKASRCGPRCTTPPGARYGAPGPKARRHHAWSNGGSAESICPLASTG